MFTNYLKIAWRNLARNKTFSVINILGLSLGITFVLLTAAFVWREWRVNRDLKDNARTYIIQSRWKDPNMGLDFTTLAPLSRALKEQYPGLVEDYYHHDGITSIVSKGEKKFSEGLQVGDTSFISMFGFPLLYGQKEHPFNGPYSLVLTAAKAIKYFGRADVVGETLTLNSFSGSRQDFAITAVMKDPPFNTVTWWGKGTQLNLNEFFLPAESLKFFGRDAGFTAWQNAFIISYVKLKPGVTPADLNIPVARLLKSNLPPDMQKNLTVYFTPLNDYYLSTGNGTARRMIYALAFVALFILMMAMVNFINISIGHAVTRLKEIGVRKSMGGSRTQLIFQFMAESILLVALATGLALLGYALSRRSFSDMIGAELSGLHAFPALFLLIPFGLALVVGALAGLYPAFVLSGQPAAGSLKGKLRTVGEKIYLRKGLVVIQFVTAIVVFVSAITVDRQVSFFLHGDLGYQKEQVITAKVPRDWSLKGYQHLASIRDEMASLPIVKQASLSFEIPDGASAGSSVIFRAGQDSSQGVISTSLFTDEKYISTYSIPMAAGKFFNEKGGIPDSLGLVLNEKAIRVMGWKDAESAVGGQLMFQGGTTTFTIVGVVKDFHFGSMSERIAPMFFVHLRNNPVYRYLSFRVAPGDMGNTIAALQQKWSTLMPDAPFEYLFMDDVLARLYPVEMEMQKASRAATAFALIIVLLGVLGMVTLSLNRRNKEMGIRKVLGASVSQVIGLFAREFTLLMILANLIAWPLAWMLVSRWMDQYAYRVGLDIAPFLFVATCLSALVAGVILLRTWRAATESPSKSLRME